jgi:hypothetical protein
MITMAARFWHEEAQRVLVRGETLSKMSHRPLHFSYKVFLNRIMPLAAAAVHAGNGDSQLLTGLYIGQELRREGHLGIRPRAHTGHGGSDVILELAHRTSQRKDGRIVTPLGGPRERRDSVRCRYLSG